VALAAAAVGPVTTAFAANDAWKNPVGGVFSAAGNWVDGSAPGAGDTAIFGPAGTYNVSFTSSPQNQHLGVLSGVHVTFLGSSTTRTYTISGNASLVGPNASLTLGGAGSTPPIHLNALGSMALEAGAFGVPALSVKAGSDLSAGTLSVGASFDGTGSMSIDGAGSTLSVAGTTSLGGGSGSYGEVEVAGGASATFAGTVHLGGSATSVTTAGAMTVTGPGSSVTASGGVLLATGASTPRYGSLDVVGGASFTHTGANLTVGASSGTGRGDLSVTTGGVLTSTGLIAVEATGNVNISARGGAGTLHAGGGLAVNGGDFQVGPNATFTVGAGKPFTIAGGSAWVDLGHVAFADGQTMTTTGGSTRARSLKFSGSAALDVGAGGSLDVDDLTVGEGSAGSVTVHGASARLDRNNTSFRATIGAGPGGAGTMTVSGGATARMEGPVTIGSAGATSGQLSVLAGGFVSAWSVIIGADGTATAGSLSLSGVGADMFVGDGDGVGDDDGDLVIGAATSSTGMVTVGGGAVLTTDFDAPTTIHKNGTLTIEAGGLFDAGDDVTVDGGRLIGTASTARLSPRDLALVRVQNGGLLSLQSDLTFINRASLSVTGSGSSVILGNAAAKLNVGLPGHVYGSVGVSAGATLLNAGTTVLLSSSTLTVNGGTADLGTLDHQGGTLNFVSGSLAFTGNLNVAPGAPLGSQLSLGPTRALAVRGTVTVPSGQALTVAGGSLTTGALSVAGQVRVNGGTMTVTQMTPDAVRAMLLAGRIDKTAADANGVLAVGYWFDGASMTATTPVVLRMTYAGDANLDGRINADDYALLDRGRSRGPTGWGSGDFNYDNAITAADYLLIDRSFTLQGNPLSAAFLAERESQFGAGYVARLLTSIPEPSPAACLLATGLLTRRRRR
jgi:hypothetical protein